MLVITAKGVVGVHEYNSGISMGIDFCMCMYVGTVNPRPMFLATHSKLLFSECCDRRVKDV